jgi:hypothetical protein
MTGSTEIFGMEIDENKLSCPIAPIFLEWDRNAVKTLAAIMIGAEMQGRR